MKAKKETKKPKKGDRKKMFGIWFTWGGTCWSNEYIPFFSFRDKGNG